MNSSALRALRFAAALENFSAKLVGVAARTVGNELRKLVGGRSQRVVRSIPIATVVSKSSRTRGIPTARFATFRNPRVWSLVDWNTALARTRRAKSLAAINQAQQYRLARLEHGFTRLELENVFGKGDLLRRRWRV